MPDGRDSRTTPRASAAHLRPGSWRAEALLTAPHKLCFFWAAVQWATAAAWWAAAQVALTLGVVWPWQVPAGFAHGLWFALGAMPLFIAGFMFTAGPRWLRQPPVDARALRLPIALFSLGWACALAGFHASALLAAVGLAFASLGWSLMAHRMLRLVATSTEPDRLHPKIVATAAVCTGASLAAASVALAIGRPELLHAIVRFGLWCGVALVFVVVSHRMLPFLGEGAWPALDARWPDWPLWLLASVPLLQGAAALLAPWLDDLPAWRWLVAAHLALAGAASLRLTLRWLGQAPLKQPMMAMLFRPLLWWDAALWLGAAAWLPLEPSLRAGLATAFLHALTLGYLGGTMLAMVTRVSSAHGGRPHPIDRFARVLHAMLQVAVVTRVAAALWPEGAGWLLPLAALAWCAVAVPWALRHGRWLGEPRPDGRPG